MALPMKRVTFRFFLKKLVKLSKFSTGNLCFRRNLVRVRFAPSPTGQLHLGSLRTALFNYCIAKSHKEGAFILRIEDTDQTRTIPGAKENIIDVLNWAGLAPDEGPHIGGNFGPYIQSERKQIYQDAANTLLKSGAAYPCFCTEHRLELLRKEATRRKEIPTYDNKCRKLTEMEIKDKKSKNIPWVIRLKVDNWQYSWDDIVYGPIDINHKEGDPVMIKTDGYPTYHFANVVDDHLMKITHVLRGEEWQSSTPKHLALYKAFGWDPPKFAHLPLILNADGTKLSKRQGDTHVDYFKKKGYPPLVLLNYITLTGGGFSNAISTPLYQQLDQIVKKFDIKGVVSHSGRLDPPKLEILNRMCVLESLGTDAGRCGLVQETSNMIREHYKHRYTDEQLEESLVNEEHIYNILQWALPDRITRPEELLGREFVFLWEIPDKAYITDMFEKIGVDCYAVLAIAMELIPSLEQFDANTINTSLREEATRRNIPVKQFLPILRYALCTVRTGPSVGEMMSALGTQQTLYRLQRALNLDSSASNAGHT